MVSKGLNLAEKSKIVSKSVTGFAHYYMDDAEQRRVLYLRWITMRKFSPRLSKIKRLINKHKIKTRMMFGRYDSIIRPAGGKRFLSGIEDNATLKVVDLAHHLLNEGNARGIAEFFND